MNRPFPLLVWLTVVMGLIVATSVTQIAVAETHVDDGRAAIRATLVRWTADFNAGNATTLCSLFTPDLKYDYRGFPERDFVAMCDLLHKSVSDPRRRFHYDVDIKEILVSGDLAVTRLTWTLSVCLPDGSKPERASEVGMDIFRRQPDGGWKIWRYIAYEAP